jgi:hypothetical protein
MILLTYSCKDRLEKYFPGFLVTDDGIPGVYPGRIPDRYVMNHPSDQIIASGTPRFKGFLPCEDPAIGRVPDERGNHRNSCRRIAAGGYIA